jgi:ribosomal protein L20
MVKKKNYIYRARGTYKATGKNVWITKRWVEEKALAENELTNSRFRNVTIIKEDELELQRKGQRPKVIRKD